MTFCSVQSLLCKFGVNKRAPTRPPAKVPHLTRTSTTPCRLFSTRSTISRCRRTRPPPRRACRRTRPRCVRVRVEPQKLVHEPSTSLSSAHAPLAHTAARPRDQPSCRAVCLADDSGVGTGQDGRGGGKGGGGRGGDLRRPHVITTQPLDLYAVRNVTTRPSTRAFPRLTPARVAHVHTCKSLPDPSAG